jgi:hypothetical protein
LEAILEAKLVALTSAELRVEWLRHQSDEFIRWLRRMHGRKLVSHMPLRTLLGLNARLAKVAATSTDAEAMSKDAHLVAAGIEHGGRVLSLDETARRLFAGVAGRLGDVGGVHWANPAVAEEWVVEWLREGAPADDSRTLRARESRPLSR